MGDAPGALWRKADDRIKTTVFEIYNPHRAASVASLRLRLGIEAGAALDITTCNGRHRSLDFTDQFQGSLAMEFIHKNK